MNCFETERNAWSEKLEHREQEMKNEIAFSTMKSFAYTLHMALISWRAYLWWKTLPYISTRISIACTTGNYESD